MKSFLKLTMATVMASAVFCTGQEAAPDAQQAPDQAQVQADVQDQGQPAPDQNQPAPDQDKPSAGETDAPAATDAAVARVSFIRGDVSTQRGDSGDWSAATLNQPVVAGDKISTGNGARAELQLDFANLLRLGSNAQANVAELTGKRIQVQVGQGLATYSVFGNSEVEPEIDTPNVAIHPAHKDGSFRVEVRSDGDTIVIARKGEAELSTSNGSVEIHDGEMVTVRGTAQDAQYKTAEAPGGDDWDRWNSERDGKIQNADAWHHTNNDRYYTGAEDLDTYGQWKNVPDYGDVWVPQQSAGWAPYRAGHWVYEPYYGWTWVSDEPWGWAPYHYGRWMYADDAWMWWPGPVWGGGFYRPIWAPAYVSFWGFGGGFGFGFGGGFGWGWLPIGPCDFFHPWWGYGRGRFGVTNIRNVTNINNRFGARAPLHAGTQYSNLRNLNNDHVFRAMSTAKGDQFGTSRMRATPATRQMFNNAHMMNGNLPVVPTKASLSASGRAAAPGTIRSGPSNFYGRAPTTRSASFDHQVSSLQQSIKQDGHFSPVQAGGRTSMNPIAQSRSLPGSNPQAGSVGKPNAGTNESRMNEARTGNYQPRAENNGGSSNASMPRSTPQSGGERNGWKPFVPPSHSGNTAGESVRGNSSPERGGNVGRPGSGSYWDRTAPSSPTRSNGGNYGERIAPSRGAYSSPGSSGRGYGYSRPQLDMHQRIAQPRSSGGYGGGGGYRPAPSYGSGGGRPAPSYGGGGRPGGYSGGGGGGSHGAPSGGGQPSGGGHSSGGHSSGGGGSHSSGGGGGHHR